MSGKAGCPDHENGSLTPFPAPPFPADKELSQILGQTGRHNRTVDLLVRERLRDGGEQWILLHLEIPTGGIQCGVSRDPHPVDSLPDGTKPPAAGMLYRGDT